MPEALPRRLRYGMVIITWPREVRWPIAVDHLRPDGAKPFVTACEITFQVGKTPYKVRENYYFDGASIPWYVRWIPGFQKLGWHLFAALPHDAACDSKGDIPRSVGDGIFIEILLAIAQIKQRRARTWLCRVWYTVQAWLMFFAVSVHTFRLRVQSQVARRARRGGKEAKS